LDDLKQELADVKNVLRNIQDQVKQVKIPALPSLLQEAYHRLIEQDVEEQLAAELVHAVFEHLGAKQSEQRKKVEQELLSRIAGMIKVNTLEQPKKKNPVVIALVGPTGVGKTTTIAKLSSVSKLLTHKDVALISADTYRIGAIEQLKTFAAIATIPMDVVYEPSDVRQSLKEFQDKDVIYLDTVGRSQRNENDLIELQSFLKAAKPDEIHLVLNPSMSFKTILDVVERFKVLHPNRVLFTKLDEATTFGRLLNVVYRYNLIVSYICNGQTVPDDLQAADADHLASLVYKGALAHA
jgi:flagellar biosynthesis protein FlhF